MLSQKQMSEFGSEHNGEYFVLFFYEFKSVFQEMLLFKSATFFSVSLNQYAILLYTYK